MSTSLVYEELLLAVRNCCVCVHTRELATYFGSSYDIHGVNHHRLLTQPHICLPDPPLTTPLQPFLVPATFMKR